MSQNSMFPGLGGSMRPGGNSALGNGLFASWAAAALSPAASSSWLQVLQLAHARMVGAYSQSIDIAPIYEPVLELLANTTIRSQMLNVDELQAFYGAMVVKVSERYMNVREVGSNAGADVESFQKDVGIGKGNAWCAAFAFSCHVRTAKLLGGDTTAPKSANASAMWFNSKNKNTSFSADSVYNGLEDPRSGDLFVFDKVLDNEGAANRERKKAVDAAARTRDGILMKAKKDKLTGEELAIVKKDATLAYDEVALAATTARDKRTKGMVDGHKLLGGYTKPDAQAFVGGHTGIVKMFDAAEKTIVTIEGNTSSGEFGSRDGDGVFERDDRMNRTKGRRKYPQLYGFVRPKIVFI